MEDRTGRPVVTAQNPQSCSWLVVRSNQFGSQDPSQIHWRQKPTRRHTDQGKFRTWWVEQSSSFVQHKPFQLSLLHSEFQLEVLLQNDGEEDPRTKGRRQDCGEIEACGDEPVFNCLDEFPPPQIIRWRQKARRYSNHIQGNLTRGQEEIQKPDAASSSQRPAATDKSQQLWEFSEAESWINNENGAVGKLTASLSKKSTRIREFQNWKQNMATSFSNVSSSRTSRGESLFYRKKDLRPKSDGWFGWPRREYSYMGYIHERHPSSRSSSW